MLNRPTVVRRWVGLWVTVVAMLGAATTFFRTPVNGNIRYEVGVKAVSGFSAAETFSHRPLAYRLLMDGVASVADAMSFDVASFELAVRLIVVGLAAGAAVLLWHGLRNRGVTDPGLYAAVTFAGIVFMGAGSTAEPDWMAAVLATAGAGVALAGHGRLRWPLAVAAGVLFVAAGGMKLVTLPTALLGLLVVGVLDRRQLLRALVGSVAVGVAFVAATAIWVPWEIGWLVDIRTVQPAVTGTLPAAATFFLESAARWPAVALVPAALILTRGTERLVVVAALLLCAVPIVAQGQYFTYHAVPLCVVTSVVGFRMLRQRMTTIVGIGVLVVVLAAAALTATSAGWRDAHQAVWGPVTVAVVVLAAAWAVAVRRRPPTRGRLGPLLAALSAMALLYPVMTPFSAHLVRLPTQETPNPVTNVGIRARHEDTARRVRERIGGANVPVTYLTFGEWTYFVGNPTVCRYPSPLFLQRTTVTPGPIGTPSYRESLGCLGEPTSRWLIWDRQWFALSKTPQQVQDAVATEWDCAEAFSVRELTICPRRG